MIRNSRAPGWTRTIVWGTRFTVWGSRRCATDALPHLQAVEALRADIGILGGLTLLADEADRSLLLLAPENHKSPPRVTDEVRTRLSGFTAQRLNHFGFSHHVLLTANVPGEGVEPPSAACRAAALPLDEPGSFFFLVSLRMLPAAGRASDHGDGRDGLVVLNETICAEILDVCHVHPEGIEPPFTVP